MHSTKHSDDDSDESDKEELDYFNEDDLNEYQYKLSMSPMKQRSHSISAEVFGTFN